MRNVAVIGVGIHQFGRFDKSYQELGREAAVMALKDAGIAWKDIQVGISASMNLPPTVSSRIFTSIGMTSSPMFDVECASASGIVPLWLGYHLIASGAKDSILVLGVEQMPRGFMDPRTIYQDWQIKDGDSGKSYVLGPVGPTTHGGVRYNRKAASPGIREKPQERCSQSLRYVPERDVARGGDELSSGLRSAAPL